MYGLIGALFNSETDLDAPDDASGDASGTRRSAEPPMPSLWAAAVALAALLGFGVFVGSILSPPRQSASTVLLAASAPRVAAQRGATGAHRSSAPPSSPEATPEAPSEESPAATTTTTTTTSSASPQGSPAGNANAAPAPASGEAPAPGSALPSIRHVFLIVLSDESESAAFGSASQAPYLSKTLRKQGELIESYYAISGGELANGIALVSGQGPTPQTAEDCPLYGPLSPGTPSKLEQSIGSGCVYPSSTLTLSDQLSNAGRTWKAYAEDVEDAPGQPQTCRHPTLGAADGAHVPQPGDAYVTWRNPFVYFQSLTAASACSEDDVGLGRLATDLRTASSTPSFAYIIPDRCHDGSPQPCAPGQPAGLSAADAFLRKLVPEIEGSSAYRQDGLIAITFDQAPQSGPQADPSGCCISSPYPNMPATGTPSTAGTPSSAGTAPAAGTPSSAGTASDASAVGSGASSPVGAGTIAGGGKVGLLLISKYVKPNTLNATGEYDHFSLLRSIESLFGLKPLGYAAEPSLLAFDRSVFNAAAKR